MAKVDLGAWEICTRKDPKAIEEKAREKEGEGKYGMKR